MPPSLPNRVYLPDLATGRYFEDSHSRLGEPLPFSGPLKIYKNPFYVNTYFELISTPITQRIRNRTDYHATYPQ